MDEILSNLSYKSEKLDLNFEIHIENQASKAHQKCHILTVHNVGKNHQQFQGFINSPSMKKIKDKIIWIHIDLPGQEPNALDLQIKKYPSLEELADELAKILDYLDIRHVVCMGDGAGANISTYFAINHPLKCLGVFLIDPNGTSASIVESIRSNVNPFGLFLKHNTYDLASELFKKFGKTDQNDNTIMMQLKEDETEYIGCQNSKNLNLFSESFLNRQSLFSKLKNFEVDALIVSGKHSSGHTEAKNFYRYLQELNKNTPNKMVNTSFLEISDATNVLEESCDRLASSFQYFLQGIGLLSAMPMRNQFKNIARTLILAEWV